MSAAKKWGHDELASDLASHLRANTAIMAWENMQLGPAGSPRPDVYAVSKSFAKFAPIAYEAKISIADFRRDVTAGKWQSYLQFAAGVVFAAPAGLITKADIPPGCGLILRHESGWWVAKGPTLGNVGNLPRDAWLKLLMDGVDREVERQRIQSRGQGSIWNAERDLRRKLGEEISTLIPQAYHSRKHLADAIEKDREERRQIEDGTHKRVQEEIKFRRESLDREALRLTGALAELGHALGLPEDATTPQLTKAVVEATRRLAGDREIQRLRAFLAEVQSTAARASEPLPGEKLMPAEPVPAPAWGQTGSLI